MSELLIQRRGRDVPQITLRFHACIIGTEGFATDDEGDYFDGEVDFDLVLSGAVHRGLVAKVKQAAGSRFADPLEVMSPGRYVGPFHYGRFRDCVERYVRQQVNAQVVTDRRKRDTNIRLHDVRLPAEGTCSFAVQ